jgi:hypothetical protein
VIVFLTRSSPCPPCHLVVLSVLLSGCTGQGVPRDAPDGANQPPLGTIERPLDYATQPPSFKVMGWAGDDTGIRAVRVFVDDELAAVAHFLWERPDVTRAYPHFRHGTDRHGWEATVVIGTPGIHSIHVEAVDVNASTVDLGTRRVLVVAQYNGSDQRQ